MINHLVQPFAARKVRGRGTAAFTGFVSAEALRAARWLLRDALRGPAGTASAALSRPGLIVRRSTGPAPA